VGRGERAAGIPLLHPRALARVYRAINERVMALPPYLGARCGTGLGFADTSPIYQPRTK